MGMRVAQHVIDCFLRDAKTRRLRVRVELVRRLRGVEMGREAADAGLAIEMRAQRRCEAQIVELRRTQAERELAHALERLLDRHAALRDARAPRRLLRARR